MQQTVVWLKEQKKQFFHTEKKSSGQILCKLQTLDAGRKKQDAVVEFQVHCNSFTAAHTIIKADAQHKALVKKIPICRESLKLFLSKKAWISYLLTGAPKPEIKTTE